MAERRMFAKSIIDSDAFLDMPLSAQALYFHLSMRADDEGFVGNPKRIRGMIGASEDDLKLLVAKRFILTFPSGIVVIKHWRIHNYLQNDRCKPTTYIEERETLTFDEKKAYTERLQDVGEGVDTKCIQDVSEMYTQDRLGKDRVGKNEERKKINIYNNQTSAGARGGEPLESYDSIMDDFEVGPMLRSALWQFIQHCAFNGKKLTNNKLKDIILRLQEGICYTEYGERQDKEQADEIYRAINGGYFDIKVWRK